MSIWVIKREHYNMHKTRGDRSTRIHTKQWILVHVFLNVSIWYPIKSRKHIEYKFWLMINRNFCSVHEEITSIRLYTMSVSKGVYNLIEVISNELNK
jgi:hypothetical protein